MNGVAAVPPGQRGRDWKVFDVCVRLCAGQSRNGVVRCDEIARVFEEVMRKRMKHDHLCMLARLG